MRNEGERRQFAEKGRRGVLRLVYGRTLLTLAALVVQLGLILWAVEAFSKHIPMVFGGYVAFTLVIVLVIINKPRSPEIKLTWTILTLLLPVVGGALYLFVETAPGYRLMERRLKELYGETAPFVQQDEGVRAALEQADVGTARLADYVRENGNSPVYQNTDVTYFPSGEAKFAEMLRQLEGAQEFIFLEYFIIKEGEMWSKILDILRRKAAEGVEVRVLYDGTCALFNLPYSYPKTLQAMGIQCKMFAPIHPVLSTHYNNRDHRKILVIDGEIGFTGGVNIGDEYINRESPYGHWKDVAVMLRGDAVQGLTMLFLQMWNVTEKAEDYGAYLRKPQAIQSETGFVMPYGDSPFDDELIGETVYMDILNRAKEYVHIMTPYLILDQPMITALTFAAKRGVDVKLILPHIPDKAYAFALAKGHYRELLRAGVRIYEYTPGFVHAKVFSSDGEKAVVGTINLDYRSLYLHFECAVFLYRVREIARIEADFQETLAKCQEITPERLKEESKRMQLYGRLLKVFAPLM